MKMFEYTAVNKDGNMVQGRVEADSREDAMILVKEESLFPTKMQEMSRVGSEPDEETPNSAAPVILILLGLLILGGLVSGVIALLF